MTLFPPLGAEMADLLESLCLEELSPADAERLEELVRSDPGCCRQYIVFMQIHALAERFGGKCAAGNEEFGDLESCRFGDLQTGDSGFGVGDSGFGVGDSNLQISKSPNQQIPPLSTTHYPLPTPFVGGPVFSYIAATLILGVMLLSAWAYKISHDHRDFAQDNSRGSTTPGLSTPQPSELIFVARVTGMKDCRWSDPATETFAGAYVPLGRKYALSSGLMEITYLSGAKVILEGPCRYEVESDLGGYLALGKLTAKVESMKQSPKPQDLRPKTEISKSPNLQINSPLSTLHSPLFTVRTPAAVITDLGTEFGVELSDDGSERVVVFSGVVCLAKQNGLVPGVPPRVLKKGQVARYNSLDGRINVAEAPANSNNGFSRDFGTLLVRPADRARAATKALALGKMPAGVDVPIPSGAAGPRQPLEFIGPVPYRSFEDRAATSEISPFSKAAGGLFGPLAGEKSERRWQGPDGRYFYLEDLESGAIRAPGLWIATHGRSEVIGAGRSTNSVDEDDGAIDFATDAARAHSLFISGTGHSLRIGFDADVLGRLPSHVGIVLTDYRPEFDTVIEVYGAHYRLLGKKRYSNKGLAPDIHHLDANAAKKARFIGVICAGAGHSDGIELVILNELAADGADALGGGIEVDHIQYGFTSFNDFQGDVAHE